MLVHVLLIIAPQLDLKVTNNSNLNIKTIQLYKTHYKIEQVCVCVQGKQQRIDSHHANSMFKKRQPNPKFTILPLFIRMSFISPKINRSFFSSLQCQAKGKNMMERSFWLYVTLNLRNLYL